MKYIKGKKVCNRDIFSHVAEYRTKKQKRYPNVIGKKILDKYLELVWEQVLQGYKWSFPNGFGDLWIEWEPLNPKLARFNILKGKKVNLSRINKYYSIKLKSPLLEKRGIKFQADKNIRKVLHQILITTNHEYRSTN